QPLTHEGRVIGATFSHDEKRILSWSEDGTARLWDAVNGTQIGQPFKKEGWVNGALFSKDDTRILTWSWNFFASPAQLWNVATGTPITEFRHPGDGLIDGAMFMSDESRILTWGHDGTARLWNVTTGMQDGPPFTHGGAVLGAIFSKDDSRVLSWSEDG